MLASEFSTFASTASIDGDRQLSILNACVPPVAKQKNPLLILLSFFSMLPPEWVVNINYPYKLCI
jgi:hypothetical protein